MKNEYGEKVKVKIFNVLGIKGTFHNLGKPNFTWLNSYVNYWDGAPGITPRMEFFWQAGVAGAPDKGFVPKNMYVAFKNGNIKTIPLQGYIYQKLPGPFFTRIHSLMGTIRLSEYDVYDIWQNGDIAAVSIDDGIGKDGLIHFFYSSDKDEPDKVRLTHGFQHAVKMIGIDDTRIKELKAKAEEERVAKIRAEVEKELKEEEEREAIKQQLLAERAAAKGDAK